MSKSANTSVPILPLLAERWSPRSFDQSATMSDEQLIKLLEAARWSPSGSNMQPWRFIVARRGEPEFDVIVGLLAGFNAVWAPHASALLVGLHEINDVNGKLRMSAQFDLGLAIANLQTQAQADGWHTHPIGGFNRDATAAAFELDSNLKPTIVLAIGRLAAADLLSEELATRENAPRTRLSLDEIVLRGLPD